MKYAFIQDQLTAIDDTRRFSLNTWCHVLDVSRSGFYEWQSRCTKPDPDTTALDVAARAAHARGRECYGPKRLRTELASMSFVRSSATIKRLRARLGCAAATSAVLCAPPMAITRCPMLGFWHPICSNRSSIRPVGPIKSGSPTSPTCPPMKAGCDLLVASVLPRSGDQRPVQ